MDFFRSILSDEREPPISEKPQNFQPSDPSLKEKEDEHDLDNQKPNSKGSEGDDGGGWSFGGLIKTLATRSESVLEIYRRDLKEFGSGLKKETEAFREAANRAVKEFPASIEVGASVAKGSVETVSHAIDGVLKSTTGIISHGKGTFLTSSDVEYNAPDAGSSMNQCFNPSPYSRFDSQIRAIQSDVNTFSEEPEDLDDYSKWKLGFVFEEKSEEIENLIKEDGALAVMYKKMVPQAVEHDIFWCRYFYRVHKLKQQEVVRASLVKRAISAEDDEELSWDVDDEDEEPKKALKSSTLENKERGKEDSSQFVKDESSVDGSEVGSSKAVDDKAGKKYDVVNVSEGNVAGPSNDNGSSEKVQTGQAYENEAVLKSNMKELAFDGKGDHGESYTDSNVSAVSSQPSLPEEEDLGWDEIEDLGSSDEKKVSHGESPKRADLRKRLSAADEDEDLNWDIEDDDEPVKS